MRPAWLHGPALEPSARPDYAGRLLTPENAGRVGFDLVKHRVEGTGVEVVITVPAAVAVGPVQAPVVGAGAVAQLGHAHLGPSGQVRVPRRSAVEDGDRVSADGGFDADLVEKAGWDPGSAVLADLGDVGLWWCWHPTTVGLDRLVVAVIAAVPATPSRLAES
jgi:hypothetical protein